MLAVGVAACSSGGRTHTNGAGPACVASQLRLSPGPFISPATGQNPHPIRVVNTGAACRLDGYPSIQLRDRRNARLPFVIRTSGDQMVTDRMPAPVSLHRGAAAWFLIDKYRCDTGDRAFATRLVLEGGGSSATVTISLPYCGRGDPGSIVHVSPYEPTLRATLRHG